MVAYHAYFAESDGLSLNYFSFTKLNSEWSCIPLNFTLSESDMDLSLRNLEQAVSIRRQIDALQKRLTNLVGGRSSAAPRGGGRGRTMSAEARAKIAAAARARWARVRARRGPKTAQKSSPRRGKLTAAGRKRLSDLMKARWAAKRRAQSRK